MRKGRYKKNFLTPEQCPDFASAVVPLAQDLLKHREQNQISAPKLVADFHQALHVLNTSDENASHLEVLESEFRRKGQPASFSAAIS